MANEQAKPTGSKQTEIPARDRWKIRIRRSLAERNLDEATQLARQALDEFPEDLELAQLEERVLQWKQRKIQAYLWLDEGKQLCAENNFQEGLQVLRSAVILDEHDPTPRAVLLDALLRAAVETVETDWPSAVALVQEAVRMDPANPVAQSVLQSVQEKEHSLVSSESTEDSRKEIAIPAQGPTEELPCPQSTERVAPAAMQPVSKPVSLHSSPPPTPKVHPKPAPARMSPPRPEAGRPTSERPAVETNAPNPPARPAPARERPRRRKAPFPMWTWAADGALVLAICCLLVWRAAYGTFVNGRPVPVEIRTVPAGAEVRINGEPFDIARQVSLSPGKYRVEAFLDGYEPAVLETNITRQSRSPIELTLVPAKEDLSSSTDLGPGAVDGNPAGGRHADRNVGAIEIVTDQQEPFDVLVNGKAGKLANRKGRYYLYNLAAKPVRIALRKQGFRADPPEQRITVRKGRLTKVSFDLTPIPTTGTLKLPDLLPGTRVRVDGAAQELAPNGSLKTTVSEGDHSVQLTRPGFRPKSLRVAVKAGQTVTVKGSETTVDHPTTGRLVLTGRSPAEAAVVLRRDGSEIPVLGRGVEVPEGEYTLVASAAGYHDQSRPVRIAENALFSVDIRLASIPQPVHMDGWDDPAAWRLENGWYTRKGGNFVLFQPSSKTGTWHLTARSKGKRFFGGSRIRWITHYVDEQNYDLYQMDKENLSWRRVVDGKPGPEKKRPHGANIEDDTFHLDFDVSSGAFGGKVFNGQKWIRLPRLEDPVAQAAPGRFGLFLPGNEEIWVTGVEFKPTE